MSLGPNFFGKPAPASGPFSVVVHIVAKGGDDTASIRESLLAVQKSANSDAEPDCTEYKVTVADDDPNTFVVYEEYRNAAAVEHHAKCPAFVAFAQKRDKVEIGHLRYYKHIQ